MLIFKKEDKYEIYILYLKSKIPAMVSVYRCPAVFTSKGSNFRTEKHQQQNIIPVRFLPTLHPGNKHFKFSGFQKPSNMEKFQNLKEANFYSSVQRSPPPLSLKKIAVQIDESTTETPLNSLAGRTY